MGKIYCAIFIVLLASSSFGQVEDFRLSDLDKKVEQLMNKYQCVGLSLAIVVEDSMIYAKGYGFRDLQNKLPVTSNTLFGIGSVTKQFTAGLIGIYEDRKMLSVYDRPAKYLEKLIFSTDEMNTIVTVEDLLAHRSGLGNLDGAMVFFPKKDLFKNIERLPHLIPSSQVRESMDYSNMGYSILGAISESISGRSWSENIQQEIFNPLGMHHSNTSIEELQNSTDFSLAYSVDDELPVQVVYDPLDETSPGGSINSSAIEMTYWVRMLLAGGKFKENQVISQTYLERAFSSQTMVRNRFTFGEKDPLLFDTYGYGVAVNDFYDHYRVQHSGAVSGFTASVELFPFENLGIVVLTNQHLSALSQQVVDIIARDFLGLTEKELEEYEVQKAEARMYDEPVKQINKSSPPAFELSKYCGTYAHFGYGQMEITLQDDHLLAKFPAFDLALEHVEENVFYNKSLVKIHQNCPSFDFTFLVKYDKVTGVSIPLQTTPVRFDKL